MHDALGTHFELSPRADGLYQVVDTRTGNRSIPLTLAAARRVLKALGGGR